MEVIDVEIDGESLAYDYHCLINAVTISPLVKKQYLVDLVAADGARDLSAWFGAPRFESRTLTVYAQCASETSVKCADRLSNLLVGDTVNVKLSFDPEYFRTGMLLQVVPTTVNGLDELQIIILCDPYKYRCEETVHEIAATEESVEYTWTNAGKQVVVPSVRVDGLSATLVCGSSRYTLETGEYTLTDLAIDGISEITVAITGGPITARYREAVL